jgi:VWFA-related protein
VVRTFILLFFTTGLTAVLHAQQDVPLFRSEASDLVVLSAIVTDGDRGFVSGLGRERFTVFDNGERQSITFFSNEDVPVSVGLVLDSSGSLRGRIGELVAAAVALAKSSHPEDELFALAFNDGVREAIAGRRFLLARDVAALQSAVSSLRAEGRTSLYDAILAGLDRLDEGSRARKVLIVLSDGGDNASGATLDRVLERARRSQATIYTIGLFGPDDPDGNPDVLERLARATGGVRFLPHSPGPLLQACERIALDIRSGYTIGFEPSARDGAYHRLEVDVEGPGARRLEVRARPGYVAPADPTSQGPAVPRPRSSSSQ